MLQHVGLWSQASHYADNVVYGLRGPHPAQMAQSQHVCGQYSSTQTGQRNGVWPPAWTASRSGRTSRPGDPRSNPQGAGTDRPRCLLPTACLKTNSTIRRETCEDRHARLPCGDAVPEV